MKTYLIYILFFILYLFVSNYLISAFNKPDVLTTIVLYWMIFCVLIGVLEVVLFFTSKYISQLPQYITKNYWLRDITTNKIFHSNFWSHVWKEYGDFCDSRYIKPKNIVHWLEINHAVTSFIYIYIIYKLITGKTITKNKLIGILMIAISSVHIIGTIIYLLTLDKYLKKNPIKKTNKFWSYLSLNFLWVFMPVFVLVKGCKII